MSKKILIHSIVFSPDGVSTAYLYNDIASKFKEKGYAVSVLTTTPHYNVIESELRKQPLTKKAFGLYYESDFKGIKVKHVYLKKNKRTLLRLLGFIYWHIISFCIGAFEKNVDIILSPSPPLTIGMLNIILGKLKGARVVYNVQEIYPDILMDGGGLNSKPIIVFLKWLERFIYNHSDAITTIDSVFYNTIVGRLKKLNKLYIIPNFVDTELYKPITSDDINLDTGLFPKIGSLKVMYAGNIGFAQDWKTLISLVDKTRNLGIDYFVIGEGAMKEYVIEQKEKMQLDKLHILPYQKREIMPQLIAYSDLQFIFMTPEMDGNGFPSKVYTIMACGKPLIICSSENTPIVNFLKDNNCAVIFTDNDIETRAIKIADFLRKVDRNKLNNMGKDGLKVINKRYSKKIVTTQYVNLVQNLLS